jgi:circadian clock protein KaiC
MRFTSEGIRIGRPLHEFRGILTGTPVFTGNQQQMLANDGDA